VPKLDPNRAPEQRILERLRTVIGALMTLSGPVVGSVGKTASSNVSGMPRHWSTSKRVNEATMNDVARGAINNLKALVSEKPQIDSFSPEARAETEALVSQLRDACRGFELAHAIEEEKSAHLRVAIKKFLAKYDG
jgi:hypothetical protein